ncbi:MAG TPA: glycoside hydrolase family 15 protein [Mycobacteriales bacterium]|nr:glycoside hydrolase family 15 protein [Mycobacteriales bacterium]
MVTERRIEDYGVIGDTMTAALVGRDGSIDWLCLPRFDSGACFARLLGDESHGRWLLAPAGAVTASRRAYREHTLVLETEWETATGAVRVTDFMPIRQQHADVVRIVEGLRGTVRMRTELVVRFDYGRTVPWVRRGDDGVLSFVAGPDALYLHTQVDTRGEYLTTVGEVDVAAGERVPFALLWDHSHREPPTPIDPFTALDETVAYWTEWSQRSSYGGRWHAEVHRSLLTLKALTYQPTGGIVAAATTSLPESVGGVRNWDYRYCWLRDATFTLQSLMVAGYTDEASAWLDWLLRAVAGAPGDLQVIYGPAGERRLPESEVDWLPGFLGSRPVRVGNAAVGQFQLDVYGEVMDALHQARRAGITGSGPTWDFQVALLGWLAGAWREPDEGIWEVRGPRRHFTHSKVMAWVAFDRAVRAVEQFGQPGPVDEWRAIRDEIHAEVCARGWSEERGSFVQYYGATEVDASLLMIPLVGFLPAGDPRVAATVDAVRDDLCHDGLVRRYRDDTPDVDGLPPGDAPFLACSFWLVDNLALLGRQDEAVALFERLLTLRNDLGLLSEEYDPVAGRQLGNVPQAFSHVALVNSAYGLSGHLDGRRSRADC